MGSSSSRAKARQQAQAKEAEGNKKPEPSMDQKSHKSDLGDEAAEAKSTQGEAAENKPESVGGDVPPGAGEENPNQEGEDNDQVTMVEPLHLEEDTEDEEAQEADGEDDAASN